MLVKRLEYFTRLFSDEELHVTIGNVADAWDGKAAEVEATTQAPTALSFSAYCEWAAKLLKGHWSENLCAMNEEHLPWACEMVKLGRNWDLPWALKRALYEIVRTNRLSLLHPGSLDFDTVIKLDEVDVVILVNVREKLNSIWLEQVFKSDNYSVCPCKHSPSNKDKNMPQCQTVKDRTVGIMCNMASSGLLWCYLIDSICGLQALMDAKRVTEKYFTACAARNTVQWTQIREVIWENLDLDFHLL
ncbi:hypothetical protein SERLA73DRAFT_68004 [Serpula lacrymans var. lacrymans S7.3]|uniref:Uncharacterized protein n=2 Tax=Serpula lacrymans var. lacrymans TaxID=341189 RepID=F8PG55_SERL3|nr:hypothetical protein SERLA73DRAFT_68004 [Serpula lacrymans var. lacrymans S7.3]